MKVVKILQWKVMQKMQAPTISKAITYDFRVKKRDERIIAMFLILLIFTVLIFPETNAFCDIYIDNDCNGKTFTISSHEDFVISLKSNRSTGYKWSIVFYDKDIITKLEEKYESNSNKLGAPNMQIFRFKGINAGQTEIKFKYHRQWEKRAPPLQKFKINIIIKQFNNNH